MMALNCQTSARVTGWRWAAAASQWRETGSYQKTACCSASLRVDKQPVNIWPRWLWCWQQDSFQPKNSACGNGARVKNDRTTSPQQKKCLRQRGTGLTNKNRQNKRQNRSPTKTNGVNNPRSLLWKPSSAMSKLVQPTKNLPDEPRGFK